ncbi:CoB--CoM heterodisulfide reductase iron-sulfur subunit B family protein, partial [Candidatus Aminicenantes bacterium AC-334-E05]|nr:CoB--CoM heterodisulfide reductase iron-sulfur subunit B family protein [Candidatus Aminicenantes bacterium AC-334-E05]
MKISYYPGCTLKVNAKNFEDSTIASLKELDVELEELPRWNCCGTVYSLSTDDLIHHVAPIRNLLRVKEQNNNKVVTLCAMCFNTLKRANLKVREEPDSLEKINNLMYLEKLKYEGDVEVLHLIEVLRNEVGFSTLRQKITRPLRNLKVASYYGCLLVRPREIGIDDPENPTIMEELVKNLGGDPIDFPYKTECCGAYQTVDHPEIVISRTYSIISSAQVNGAEVIMVSCPLCAFNLDHRQKETKQKYLEFRPMPILYFTQL